MSRQTASTASTEKIEGRGDWVRRRGPTGTLGWRGTQSEYSLTNASGACRGQGQSRLLKWPGERGLGSGQVVIWRCEHLLLDLFLRQS